MMSEEQNPTTEEATPVVEPTESTRSESSASEPNPPEMNGSELAVSETITSETTMQEGAVPEAAPPEAASPEAPAEEPAGAEEPAPETPATAAPEAESAPDAAPTAPPSAAPPAAQEGVGPREYSGEQEGGGRGRRTSVDARYEDVHYKNVPLLSRFLDPRGRILSRRKTRVSAKVQRRVVKSIKWARHLALLPYTAEQTRIVRRRR